MLIKLLIYRKLFIFTAHYKPRSMNRKTKTKFKNIFFNKLEMCKNFIFKHTTIKQEIFKT